MATFKSSVWNISFWSTAVWDFDADVDTSQDPTFGDYAPTRTNLAAVADNREYCDKSGFLARVGELKTEWNGEDVLPKFWEARHPMDLYKATPSDSRYPASRSPEPDDTFLTTNEVDVTDL